MDWTQELTDFWFGLRPEQWWTPDPQLDEEIRERFGDLWESERQRPAESFLGSPEQALGAILLFDQVPRNIFRGHADQFASDSLALAIAKGAIERGYDRQMPPERRTFVYLPFEHSEEMEDQRRSMLLFTALGDAQSLDYARKHYDVIERFGRFPHRNEMLGRKSTEEEIAFGLEPPW